MMWPNEFTLGGLLLDRDDSGSYRVVEGAAGWDDSPEVVGSFPQRVGQDGAWDAPGYFGPRTVQVDGFVSEPSRAAARSFADQLTALAGVGAVWLSVAGDVGTRAAFVRVSSGAVLEWVSGASFRYSVTVVARDPLKYGAARYGTAKLNGAVGTGLAYPLVYPRDYGVPAGQAPGAVSVANSGTAAYWPRLRIDGPVSNPVVTLPETGDWVRFNGSLLAGQWLDFDLANRRVLLNGQVSLRQFVSSSGRWLAVPVGGGSVSWAADAYSAAATLSVWSYEGAWS